MTIYHLTVGRFGHPIHVCLQDTYQANGVIAWIVLNMIIIINNVFATITTQLLGAIVGGVTDASSWLLLLR